VREKGKIVVDKGAKVRMLKALGMEGKNQDRIENKFQTSEKGGKRPKRIMRKTPPTAEPVYANCKEGKKKAEDRGDRSRGKKRKESGTNKIAGPGGT